MSGRLKSVAGEPGEGHQAGSRALLLAPPAEGKYSGSDYSSAQEANGPDNSLGSYSSRKNSFLCFREICSQALLRSPEPSAAVASDSNSASGNAHEQAQHPLHPPSIYQMFIFPGCCKLHFDGIFLTDFKNFFLLFSQFRQFKNKIKNMF